MRDNILNSFGNSLVEKKWNFIVPESKALFNLFQQKRKDLGECIRGLEEYITNFGDTMLSKK